MFDIIDAEFTPDVDAEYDFLSEYGYDNGET